MHLAFCQHGFFAIGGRAQVAKVTGIMLRACG